jgi:hypothetical protein
LGIHAPINATLCKNCGGSDKYAEDKNDGFLHVITIENSDLVKMNKV